MSKKYKILDRNNDCVLLQNNRDKDYKVIDNENVTIYIGSSYENARSIFDSYDLAEVHREQKEKLEKWLEDFAEA